MMHNQSFKTNNIHFAAPKILRRLRWNDEGKDKTTRYTQLRAFGWTVILAQVLGHPMRQKAASVARAIFKMVTHG